MAIVTIQTPFNIDLEFKIATPGKRILAWLIDIIIICIYYSFMLRFIYPLLGLGKAVSTAASLFVIIIPVLTYQLVFELLFNGQTIGKMAAGIKVIDKDGKEPTWGQYITRWILCIGNLFIYIVPYLLLQNFLLMLVFMILYLPDFLTMVVSKKGQRIGDIAAGTVVIDKNYRADIDETIYLNIESHGYQPVFPQVMRLSDKDINGIRNLLGENSHPSKDTDHYTIEVALRIKAVLGIETNLYATDFLRQLLKDYNYYTTK
jgi:uncharacterized RDD family membrane protein YckC